MIVISAKQKQGFWRCGVFHPFEATAHDDNAFTAEQLATFRAEPMLSVSVESADTNQGLDSNETTETNQGLDSSRLDSSETTKKAKKPEA